MRLRITVLATAIAVSRSQRSHHGTAAAAPLHNRGLTIQRSPPHTSSPGEAVLIYGRLQGPGHANQVIRLYHRINPNPVFTLIATRGPTRWASMSSRARRGSCSVNRSWFVRGPGLSTAAPCTSASRPW